MRDYASLLPVLLEKDLFNAGWDGSISTYPGQSVAQFQMSAMRRSFLKKFQDAKSPSADSEALRLFLSINEKCAGYSMEHSAFDTPTAIAIGEAKLFISRFFESDDFPNSCILNLDSIFRGFGVGNGANIGSPSTDFYTKFGNSTMACTDPSIYSLYREATQYDLLWSSVESSRSALNSSEIVQGSRLSFVPKTRDISRTICTEPILNMIFQKGIASVIEQRLARSLGLDLSTQPDKNRELARLGSLAGNFGTIDLSSASDSMSNGLVREMFPRQVTYWLGLTRSPVTILPDGSVVELHMVSSMGNAFTFPLQTLLFASLVYGAYRVLGIDFLRPTRRSLGNFAVFGDDIIVEKKAYGFLLQLLSLCGFSVNIDKSFNDGPFRESCGHDYYYGRNVRGVYVKTLKDRTDVYSAINRLNVWSARMLVPLPETVSFLAREVPIVFVPFTEMDTAGVKVPLSRAIHKLKRDRHTGGFCYRYVHILPLAYDVRDVQLSVPRLRKWKENPDALLMAAIAGYLRNGAISVRVSRKSTRVKVRSSSSWDWIPPEWQFSATFGIDWKVFIDLNLLF